MCNVSRQSVEDEGAMLERDKLMAEEMTEIWKLAVPIDDARLTERVVRLKSLLHLNVFSLHLYYLSSLLNKFIYRKVLFSLRL